MGKGAQVRADRSGPASPLDTGQTDPSASTDPDHVGVPGTDLTTEEAKRLADTEGAEDE